MRHYRQQRQSSGMFRGAEGTRLLTGIVMLAVVYMLVVWAGDENTWGWLAPSKPLAASPQAVEKLPAATGPTDEDPEQAAAARDEFQAVTDGALTLGPEEMVPYNRLVEWVKNQSFARLYQRAAKGLRYSNLYDDPQKRRGQLVALDLRIRIAADAGKNDYGVQLYEAWGTTDQSVSRLYSLIVLDYPKGMPTGSSISEKAEFAGYFLKLQGYEPPTAKPGQPPEKAPLLIGRLQWEPAAAPPIDNTWQWRWGGPLLAIVCLAIGLQFAYRKWLRRRPEVRPAMAETAAGEVIPIEKWLEQAGFAADEDRLDDDGGRD